MLQLYKESLNHTKLLFKIHVCPSLFVVLRKSSETNLASSPKKGLLLSRTELLTATPSSAASSQQIGPLTKISTPGKKASVAEKIVRDPKTGKGGLCLDFIAFTCKHSVTFEPDLPCL